MNNKNYTKITKKRLDECLALIGWSTVHKGCNYYYIRNQYGNLTNFSFRSSDDNKEIFEISLDAKFGEGYKHSNGGNCIFVLSGCRLLATYNEYEECYDCVSILAYENKGAKQPAFINFYNH